MKKTLLLFSILLFGIHQSQTYYSQDFNTSGLSGWVSTDIDGDGNQWSNLNASSIQPTFGPGSLVSFSYNGAAITPNNLITSPLINLSNITSQNISLNYDLATSNSFYAEKYSIYITSSNTPSNILLTTPVYTEVVSVGGIQNKAINLTPYIGQQIYISFRHYDCSNQNYLILDNINVKSVPNKDVQLKKVSVSRYGNINTNYNLTATIKNNGSDPVSNTTINWNDGTTDHISTVTLSPALTYGQERTITHPISLNYSLAGEKNINVNVSQINGSADSNPADNSSATVFRVISQNSPKKVLVEEGTGTWCGWCPRGAVAMAYADSNSPNDFIGIAVHDNDPMMVNEYNTGANFQSFPSMNVDRIELGLDVGSSIMQSRINSRKNLLVPAALNASSSLAGNLLTFNASAIFRTNFTNANLRFAVVLVEDNVTGTATGYRQTNYYSGGSNGAMGGYENLPNPVPAAQMVYDHVGRILLGGYTGQAGSIPATIMDGQTVNYTFTATIPTTYNTNNMKAVLLLLDATTGEVINARSFLFNTLGTSEAKTNANYLTVYPNPTTDYIKIQANYNVDLKFYDSAGRLVLEKSNVSPDTPVAVGSLSKGVYLISITEKGAGSNSKTQKVIIK